ncbi:hypothetical protein [Methanogenium sp. MK-MG]|uniref:hypothetical protein n=1 Tax=Methanogenium sp. MK-MG TaxID=2599926 RepID=UPI0013EC4A29|nr:hypothetical protein [Methanogenium sp. MK-MG]KAF1075415.1 hypothetical protein MKMG_01716 [Methanogenium sp. MK-MG]
MDIIIGGGTYGERALAKIRKTDGPVIVIDNDPSCSVQKNYGLPVATLEQISDPEERQQEACFIPGGIAEAAQIVATHRPERIFPTVPVHVSAGILSELAEFEPEPAGADEISERIPERLVVGRNGADIYCSLNPDRLCNPDCPEPPICPVTGERRDLPLWSLLRNHLSGAVPEGADTHITVIIQSRQCGPGLGYIRCSDIFAAMEDICEADTAWIGTACKCHGVVTALRKKV